MRLPNTSPDPNDPTGLSYRLRRAAQADNTRIAYDKGWRCFVGYCESRKLPPLDAEEADVARFFIALATNRSPASGRTLSLGTLRIYRSALNRRYAEAGTVSPAASSVVDDILKGLARLRGDTPRQVKALREFSIAAMLERCLDSRFGRRDAAMLALGFAAALRRSELCSLKVSDVEFESVDRMIVHIRRSKTDQLGRGQRIAVPEGKVIKPVSRLKAWMDGAGIRRGYLFQTMRRGGTPSGSPLSHSEVARLVKRYATKIGLDPRDYSAHSLRAGFVTSAAAHHARLDKIMEVTRHKSPATVLRYIRDAESFTDHAGAAFL